jgi:hypothetical protein
VEETDTSGQLSGYETPRPASKGTAIIRNSYWTRIHSDPSFSGNQPIFKYYERIGIESASFTFLLAPK